MAVNEILEGQLWLGPINVKLQVIKELGITHVVNVTPSTCFIGQCTYLHIPIVDKSDVAIDEHFEETYSFITNALEVGGKVYVHCVAGVSRSTTIVLYYLMRAKQWSLHESYNWVRTRRPEIRPNLGFWMRLCDAELAQMGRVSVPPELYMISYMAEVLDISEETVRKHLAEHSGDILAAERAIYSEKFGPFIARLMFP